LIVWQKSLDLAQKVYAATGKLPRSEMFGLASQMRRAAVSIPSNIAEGQSRNSTGEFQQFLGVSNGSLAELETQIELAGRLKYLPPEQVAGLLQDCAEIGKMLNGLRAALHSKTG
jgi:four helix bundle protein